MIIAIYIATLFLFRMAFRIWWYPGLFLYMAEITIIAIAFALALDTEENLQIQASSC